MEQVFVAAITYMTEKAGMAGILLLCTFVAIAVFMVYRIRMQERLSARAGAGGDLALALESTITPRLEEIRRIVASLDNPQLERDVAKLTLQMSDAIERLRGIEQGIAGFAEFKGFLEGVQHRRFPEY